MPAQVPIPTSEDAAEEDGGPGGRPPHHRHAQEAAHRPDPTEHPRTTACAKTSRRPQARSWMPDPAPPNDPKAQARAAKLRHPGATTGVPVTRHETIASRMSPAAQLLGMPMPRLPRCFGITPPAVRRRSWGANPRLGMLAQAPILTSEAAAQNNEGARGQLPHHSYAQEANSRSQTLRAPASRSMREANQTSPGAQLDADPAPPNDPKAQACAAKLHLPGATTGGQVPGHENIASRMSPAAQSLGGAGQRARSGRLTRPRLMLKTDRLKPSK